MQFRFEVYCINQQWIRSGLCKCHSNFYL